MTAGAAWPVMNADERQLWLAGALAVASMGGALLVEAGGEVRGVTALDACSLHGDLLRCDDDSVLLAGEIRVLACRSDEEDAWRLVEPPSRAYPPAAALPGAGGVRAGWAG